MGRKKAERVSLPEPIALARPGTVRAAYFAGPPDMIFQRRKWVRGVAQRVPYYEWQLMQERADFARHDFRVVPAAPEPDEEKQS